MTPDQFDVIAKLIRSAPGPAQDAARWVLVDGLAPGLAAVATGCSPQSVSQSVRRFREAEELIDTAW